MYCPFVHLLPLFCGRVVGTSGLREKSRPLSSQRHSSTPPGALQGVCRPKTICNPSSKFWVCPGVSFQWDIAEKPQEPIYRRHPNQLLKPPQVTPSHTEDTSSNPSSLWMMELLTSFLRLSPATLQRKLIMATCVWDLVLLVAIMT